MKRYVYLLLSLILGLTPELIISCTPPQSGIRVWNIATKNIFITQTIESILDGISGFDVVAVFSDLDQLFNKAATIESKASLLLQDIGILQQDLVQDLSKTNQIVSNIGLLESSFALLDTSAVFTALDALQTTIVSAMDLLNNDLESIVTHIDNITLSEIDYAHTIASQLDQLDTDVNIVNSLLDALTTQFSLTTFFSLTDDIQQELVAIGSNVQILDNEIATGFAGTFSVLEQNLLLAQTIESLADELVVMQGSDLTGTYSLLDQLDISVQTMDSLADVLVNTYATIISSIDILGSALDESVSKYLFVESRTALLTQKIETLILKPAFSVIDHATSLLDRDISLLSKIYAADLPTLANTIESKLDHIISQQDVQISKLEGITTGFSLLPTLPYGTTTISKLNVIDSILDDVIADAFATESYINAATHIEYINNGQSLLNQIDYTASLVPIISSKMTQVDNNLATTNSTLDVINTLAKNNLNTITSVQSMLDAHSFIPQPSTSIASSLSVINSQEDIVISKLAVASNLIATENNEAQGLIGDFQATWTILQSIDTKLAQAYSTLSLTDRAIQSKFVSYSSVFTALDGIIANEATINSQVDVYNSMVNVLTNKISTDFNGVFTALMSVNAGSSNSISSSASLVATISSKLSNIQTELGFPIYTRNIPLTITTPGRYYLAENITYLGGSTAIVINTSNVSLDFNQRSIIGTPSVRAIDTATGLSNIAIFNGKTVNFAGIAIETGATNIRIRDMITIGGGNGYFGSGRNISVRNYRIINGGSSNAMLFQSHTNVDVADCFVRNTQGVVMQLNTSNIVINNCEFHSTTNCVLPNGSHSNVLVKNCRAMSPVAGVTCTVTSLVGFDIVNNYFETTANPAFSLQGSNVTVLGNIAINNTYGVFGQSAFANSFIGFNSFIQNTSTNVNLTSGAHTVLGNFAFNTNAVGNPANTNYNFTGSPSNLSGKSITISQKTGISGTTAPTYWHNINMLP